MALLSSSVEIPSIVDEMITIHIKDAMWMDTNFAYHILDEGKAVCRKGQFRGNWVQMRVSHLKEGIYSFNLRSCEQDACIFCFEKISGTDATKLRHTLVQ